MIVDPFGRSDPFDAGPFAAPPAAEIPRPWTDAHRREAFVRLCEVASENMRAGRDSAARAILERWSDPSTVDSEIGLRRALGGDEIDDYEPGALDAVARIDREVAIVRDRAERPAAVVSPKAASTPPPAPSLADKLAILPEPQRRAVMAVVNLLGSGVLDREALGRAMHERGVVLSEDHFEGRPQDAPWSDLPRGEREVWCGLAEYGVSVGRALAEQGSR